MNRLLCLTCLILALMSCRAKYIPVEKKVTVTETVRDTVVKVRTEKEYVKHTVPDTASTIETKYARSTAVWHGDTGMLEHTIENKPDSIEVSVQYVDRRVEVEKPVPYPVEKTVYKDKPVRMPLRWYERILQYLGAAVLGFGVFWAALRIKRR